MVEQQIQDPGVSDEIILKTLTFLSSHIGATSTHVFGKINKCPTKLPDINIFPLIGHIYTFFIFTLLGIKNEPS